MEYSDDLDIDELIREHSQDELEIDPESISIDSVDTVDVAELRRQAAARRRLLFHAKRFYCRYCPPRNRIRTSICQKHYLVRLRGCRFTCQYCGRAFVHEFALNSHIKAHVEMAKRRRIREEEERIRNEERRIEGEYDF